jgi:thiamine biosynthesis lipoprotein
MSVPTLEREAMGTSFRVSVVNDRDLYQRQAVAAAFDELVRVESMLSTYVHNSDISRINRLDPGTPEIIDIETYTCLQAALAMERRTDGAFNIAYDSTPPVQAAAAIDLLQHPCRVVVRSVGVHLDLGGIGKGYALDRMAAVLAAWEVTSAMCWCRESTFLALGPPPSQPGWKMKFGPSNDQFETELVRQAISGSGSGVKGPHIVNPRNGRPVESQRSTWATARTAAQADAFSTALMVMNRSQTRMLAEREPQVGIFVTSDDGQTWVAKRSVRTSRNERRS